MLTVDKINAEIADVIMHGDNRNDVAHLASLFVCRAGLLGEDIQVIPHAAKNAPEAIKTPNTSEFMACINGKCYDDILPVIDELMEVLRVTTPRLYNGVIRKIQD